MEDLHARLGDRYRIDGELGAGGMATVYAAEDLKHHRRVAIKVLHPQLAQALGADRFLREIEIAAALRHAHILPLFDSGADDGIPWYAMPLVEGETLRARLDRERQLPIDEAVRIAGQIAEALDYAHASGIVHRDIKPANILLEHGHALVADFGIARAVTAAGGTRVTETGLTVGTAMYMSPEQGAGERELDGRADLYSLACVVYEMLAGTPPFTGPTAQAMAARHALDPVPPLRSVRSTVPAAVEATIVRALAKVPADRYATAGEFAAALARAVAGGGRPRRVPKAAAAILVLVLLVVSVALVVALLRRDGAAGVVDTGAPLRGVAVLSFANLSADTADAYLAQGVGEEIASRLGEVPGLRVASREAVARLERSDTSDLLGHARGLGLRHLVEGSVRRGGDQVRVAVRLVTTEDGYRTWSESYDRRAGDLLVLQDEIAGDVARAIGVRLADGGGRTPQRAPIAPEAYDWLLRGNRYLADQRNPRTVQRGVAAYATAARLDTTSARAFARLALAYSVLLDWGWTIDALPPDSIFALGWAASERSLALDSASADAWIARAALLRKRDPVTLAGAVEAGRRAVALAPQSADVHFAYGVTLMFLRRWGESARAFERSLAIEPDRPVALWHMASLAARRGRLDTAEQWLDSALAVDPGFHQAYAERAAVRLAAGDTAGARVDAETVVRLRPPGDLLSGEPTLVALAARSGDGAGERLARLRRLALGPDTASVHEAIAWAGVLAAGGDTEAAKAFLEAVPPSAHLRMHLDDPVLAGLRVTEQ